MVYNPTEVELDQTYFPRENWSYLIYGDEDLKEVLPPNNPHPLGKYITMRVYVDSEYAGDKVTRFSIIGSIFYLNLAPIY